MKSRAIIFLIGFTIYGCNLNNRAVPRPRMYPKIDFPEKEDVLIEMEDCEFTMVVPAYSRVEKKESFFENKPDHPCWFNLIFDQFNATVHCSYYPINQETSYDALVNDSYTMASKHNVKADYREEYAVRNNFGSKGIIFKIEGPVASPYQFYMTDSLNHFLRGSLYFDQKMQRDSMQIVIDFLEKDIDHMLNTLKWKN